MSQVKLTIKLNCLQCDRQVEEELDGLYDFVIHKSSFEDYAFLFIPCSCGWNNHLRLGNQLEHMDSKDENGQIVFGSEL